MQYLPTDVTIMCLPPILATTEVCKEWRLHGKVTIKGFYLEIHSDNAQNRMAKISARFPNVTHLDCSRTRAHHAIPLISTYFPSLKSLTLNETLISSRMFISMPSLFSSLKSIQVLNCAEISWSALGYIAKNHPQLDILHGRARPSEIDLPSMHISLRSHLTTQNAPVASSAFLVFLYDFINELHGGISLRL